jgi:hypothetical protein
MSKQVYKIKAIQEKLVGRNLGWEFIEDLSPKEIIEKEELQKEYPLLNSIDRYEGEIKEMQEWDKMHHGRKIRDFRLVEMTVSIKEIPLNRRSIK